MLTVGDKNLLLPIRANLKSEVSYLLLANVVKKMRTALGKNGLRLSFLNLNYS